MSKWRQLDLWVDEDSRNMNEMNDGGSNIGEAVEIDQFHLLHSLRYHPYLTYNCNCSGARSQEPESRIEAVRANFIREGWIPRNSFNPLRLWVSLIIDKNG